jgi:hypothetical protein
MLGLRGNSSSGKAAFSSTIDGYGTFAGSVENQENVDLVGVDEIL